MPFNLFVHHKPQRRIPLADLAHALWQEPTAAEHAIAKKAEKMSAADPGWENQDIQDFWQQFVNPFQSSITPPLLRTIKKLLTELEQLAPSPSIIEGDQATPPQFRFLNQVSLLEHSLNVAREVISLIQNTETDFQMIAGKVLIAALSHDIGKHPAASMPNMPHSFNSAMWLQKRIRHLRDSAIIIEAVRLHHAPAHNHNRISNNPILPILIQADTNARENELSLYSVACVEEIKAQSNKPSPDPNAAVSEFPESKPKGNTDTPWFSKDAFLKQVSKQISSTGFDAFLFGDHVYVSSAKIESLFAELRQNAGHRQPMGPSEMRQIMDAHLPEVKNQKYRLRFKNNFKPLKRWFFVFEKSLLGLISETAGRVPRDNEGRWLKSLDPI